MADDTTVVPAGQADGGAPLGAGGADGGQPTTPPGTTPAPAAAPQDPQKVMSIPHSAMKRIRDEERTKGRDEAIAALAKDSGFESHLDLVQALASLRNGGAKPPAQQPTTPATPPPAQTQQVTQPNPNEAGLSPEDLAAARNGRREQAKFERTIANLTRERDTFAQKYQSVSQQAKEYKEQLDAKDAEMSLRETAIGVGVTDVDYALRLYYREVEGKSAEDLAKLDEKTFFSGLRSARPYLFSEVVKPATTGPGAGAAPPAQKPGDANKQNGANGQFDARTATPQQIAERQRKLGLNPSL